MPDMTWPLKISGLGGAFNVQDAEQAALGARERVIDQRVVAGHLELELGDRPRRPAGRVTVCMPSSGCADHAAERVDLVEDLADHVERRGEVRAADAEEDAHRLADLGLQRMQLGQRADRAVEDEIFRPLVQQLLDAELLRCRAGRTAASV